MAAVKCNNSYFDGLKKGMPIALGYLSVSFGFGISVVSQGLKAIWAVIISMTNLTSAGQVAGVAVILSQGPIIEMVLTEFVINIRYSLMGIALTQKLSERFTLPHRLIASIGITDEIFAVAASEPGLIGPRFMYGLATAPYIGWSLGTLIGAVAGNFLPAGITAALGLAIYSMFVAIIVPAARVDRGVMFTALISCALSCVMYFAPVLNKVSQGFSIIICACAAAGIMAAVMPVQESGEEAEQ